MGPDDSGYISMTVHVTCAVLGPGRRAGDRWGVVIDLGRSDRLTLQQIIDYSTYVYRTESCESRGVRQRG